MILLWQWECRNAYSWSDLRYGIRRRQSEGSKQSLPLDLLPRKVYFKVGDYPDYEVNGNGSRKVSPFLSSRAVINTSKVSLRIGMSLGPPSYNTMTFKPNGLVGWTAERLWSRSSSERRSKPLIKVLSTELNSECNEAFQVETSIDSVTIPQVHCHRHLGLVFNETLTWSNHVDHGTSKASSRIGFLRRLRQGSPPLVLQTLCQC